MTEPPAAPVVERADVAVLLLRTTDEQAAITAVWAALEDRIGSLRGRRFYGVFDAPVGEYAACVAVREGDDPAALGLERGLVSGGRYARVRLRGEPPTVYALIAPTFEQLARRPDRDDSRPSVEDYRRRDTIDLLLPVV